MFKALKYFYLATLFKKAKKNFAVFLVSGVLMVLTSLIFNDFINVSNGMSMYVLIVIKWSVNLLLLAFMGYSVLRIINLASNPLKTIDVEVVDRKKEKVLSKEKLQTKSDLIIKKYMEAK